jgi:hypothetical protein
MAAIGGLDKKADKTDPTLAAGLLCAPVLFIEGEQRVRREAQRALQSGGFLAVERVHTHT